MATSYFQDPFGAADYSAEGMPSLLSLSNLESLGRGSFAGLLGLPEDLRKMLVTKKMQENMDFVASQSGIPQVPYFLPSSEELKQRTPRMTAPTPQAGLLEDIGAFISPVPAAAAVKPLARGGKALGKAYLKEIDAAMMGERGGLLGAITPQPKQIFIGESAKTWNKANAEKAVELEKAGADPKDIWLSTGTFRGPEGKLRQEISDDASKMTEVAKKQIESNQYFSGPMGEAFENQPFFEAYPSLNWIDTFVNKELRGGTFLPEKQMINIMMPTEGGQRSVALHELQHAVQQKEKFARGGSPKSIGDLKGDLMGMEDKYNFLASEYFTATDDIVKSNILQELDYLKPRIEALQNLKNIDPEEGYMRLAGEAEARAVQSRMDMTPQERLKKFPLESYDVPIESLLFP